MTREEIIQGLKANYGTEFTAADVRGFCRMNDIAYQTVTKKLKEFNVGRGKWNLEVTLKAVENIEKSYSAPSVEPKLEQNLIPEVDDTFVNFGPLMILRPFSKPICSILRLSRVFLGMEKPLESSKLVLNSNEN